MTPHPVTETRDGVVGVWLPLPRVERRGKYLHVPGESFAIPDYLSDYEVRSDYGDDPRCIAVLHARQAERTPTPEETTVSETDDSTEADRCDCDEWPCEHNPSGIAEVVRLIRTLRRPEHDPECAHYGTWHAINGSCSCGVACAPGCHMTIDEPAPTPEPRTVTVDADDLRAVLEGDLGGYGWRSSNLRTRLRASLDSSDTGGQG